MEWIPVSKKPAEKGKYMCFVPTCKHYNKHWDEYYWDGVNFRDNTYIGHDRVVEASHYMIITEPLEPHSVDEFFNIKELNVETIIEQEQPIMPRYKFGSGVNKWFIIDIHTGKLVETLEKNTALSDVIIRCREFNKNSIS